MSKILTTTSILLLLFLGTSLQAQFQSGYLENDLIYGEMLVHKKSNNNANTKKPKTLSIFLPSVSLSFLSPDLKYGDIYFSETKTLSLEAASESEKDFNLHLNARMSYGGLGLRLKNLNFSLMHEATIDASMELPNHLFEVITKGNTHFLNSSIDINPVAATQSVHKWSLGVDYFFDKVMAGIQFHYLRGNAFFDTNSSSIKVNMEDNFFELALTKDIDIKSSGTINYHNVDSVDVIIEEHAVSMIGFQENSGFGISAQVKYKPSSSFTIFGRLEDFGFVKWNRNTNVFKEQSNEQYKGYDFQQAYVATDTYSIKDTITDLIAVDKEQASFKSSLNYSMMLGTQYRLHERITFGLIARTKKYGTRNLMLLETQATIKALPNTFISFSNMYFKSSLFNLKLVLQTEIKRTVGFNLSVINPHQLGKYYDSKMLHLSLGLYVKV